MPDKFKMDPDDIKADADNVRMFTDTMLKLTGMYLANEQISVIDVFFGIHNLHKLMVADIATRFASDSYPAEKTYRLADMQFRKAMRDLKRALPTLDRDAGVALLGQELGEIVDGDEAFAIDAPWTAVSVDPVVVETEPGLTGIE